MADAPARLRVHGPASLPLAGFDHLLHIGNQDLADGELAQVAVMEAYLPKQMTAEELEAALKEIIAETGATSGKDMGKVMGVASKKLAGLAEGRAISAKVKELLG